MAIKVGIVGTGLIAQWIHIPYVKEIEKYELAAVCDVSSSLVKTVGTAFNVHRTYSEHEEMLRKEKLDAIVVCAPDEYHDQVCVDALEAGCNVLVEKPLALSVKAADRIVRAAEKAGRKLMVAYMKRYDPGYEAGASIMQNMDDVFFIRAHDFANGIIPSSPGNIVAVMRETIKQGKVTPEQQTERNMMVAERLREQFGTYSKTKANAWGKLLGLGSHDMTALRGAFGDPVGVLATTVIPGMVSESPAETEYTTKIFSMLDYGKAKCVFELGGTQRTWFDEELVAFGNSQTTSVRWPLPWLKNAPTLVATTNVKNGGFEECQKTCSYQESFKLEHLHFINCIENDTEPRTTGKEGKKDMEILGEMLAKAEHTDLV